jgi:hypothetical protein
MWKVWVKGVEAYLFWIFSQYHDSMRELVEHEIVGASAKDSVNQANGKSRILALRQCRGRINELELWYFFCCLHYLKTVKSVSNHESWKRQWLQITLLDFLKSKASAAKMSWHFDPLNVTLPIM